MAAFSSSERSGLLLGLRVNPRWGIFSSSEGFSKVRPMALKGHRGMAVLFNVFNDGSDGDLGEAATSPLESKTSPLFVKTFTSTSFRGEVTASPLTVSRGEVIASPLTNLGFRGAFVMSI